MVCSFDFLSIAGKELKKKKQTLSDYFTNYCFKSKQITRLPEEEASLGQGLGQGLSSTSTGFGCLVFVTGEALSALSAIDISEEFDSSWNNLEKMIINFT